MKKLHLYLVILATTVFLSSGAYSQGGFSIHAGTAIPVLKFADDTKSDNEAGGAAIGFTAGGKYQYQLNISGLGLYLGADLNYNGLKQSAKDEIKQTFQGTGGSYDITYYKHLNIPVVAGLYYSCKAGESVSIFGELGLGVDFLKMTDLKVKAGNGAEASFVFKSKPQLAYEAGGGVLIQDKYIIEVHYLGLGKHSVDGKIVYDGGSQQLQNQDLKVSLVTVSLGYKF